jgi:heptosyltransferase-2
MTRALVIAPQWIGDAVMTEPLLRRLAERGEQLTVGALPWVAPVYRAMPQVVQVLELPFAHGGLQWRARWAWARRLRGQFDVAYVCPNSIKSAILPFLARIPRRVGYEGEGRIGLLTNRLPNPPKGQRPPMVGFYLALGESAVADPARSGQPVHPAHDADQRPQLHLPEADCQRALDELNLQAGGYVVMAPGAEYGSAKRWPAAHFAELAARLGGCVVLLGSAKEAALCDEIAEQAARWGASGLPGEPASVHSVGVRNYAGKTTLAQAFTAIAASKSVVTNDSGLMHVAAAFGVRQVAVFGSSSPLHTPPLNPRATVIWLKSDPAHQPPLDCAPCFQRECPLGHTRCLHDVSAQRVKLALADERC